MFGVPGRPVQQGHGVLAMRRTTVLRASRLGAHGTSRRPHATSLFVSWQHWCGVASAAREEHCLVQT